MLSKSSPETLVDEQGVFRQKLRCLVVLDMTKPTRAQMSASVREVKELHATRRSKTLIVRWPRVGRCAAGDGWLKIASFHERLAHNTIALVFSRTRLGRRKKKKVIFQQWSQMSGLDEERHQQD